MIPAQAPFNTITEERQTISDDEVIVHEDFDLSDAEAGNDVDDNRDINELEDVYIESDNTYRFFDNITLEEGLRYIAITKKLPRSTVNMLLALLRRKLNLRLPADSRTLLKTPTKVGLEIQHLLGGQFWYQGIETVLRNYFQDTIPQTDQFSLQVSVDGLPLFNSSARQLWPILIKVEELPNAPVMMIGVFCGFTKPNSITGFLQPMVTEVNNLQEKGMLFGDKMIHVKLRMFIADAPARCFIKATISYVGKHSCLKCSCVGIHEGSKVIFTSVDDELRTDAGFRNRVDKEHHKNWKSPLENLAEFNMIEDVIVADRLHLIDLGGTKKVL
uniref:Transposase domain-containing protein n=1 Tax=Anopheles epiroticus TaxID=199890 RepID=A0A182PWR9_9DIPT